MGKNLKGADENKLRLGALSFLPAWCCFAASHVLYWLVFIRNEPFWKKGWPRIDVPTIDTYSWIFTLNTTLPAAQVPDKGLIKYGFGVWGWCEWGSTLNQSVGQASCYGGQAWSIPDSAGPSSQVTKLNLPPSIAKALFPCSLLIVIPLASTMGVLIVHSLSWRYKERKPRRYWSYSTIEEKVKTAVYPKSRYSYRCACWMFNWRTMAIAISLAIMGSVPALGCAADAVSKYQGIHGIGYQARLGRGSLLLIAALLTHIFGWVWLMVGGLWQHKDAHRADRRNGR